MTTKRKLVALCEPDTPIFNLNDLDLERYKREGLDLGKVVEEATPIGRPFCIDIGCPRDSLPMYWWVWGRESLIYDALLRRDLPPKANAYTYASESMVFDDCERGNPAFGGKRDHHIVAVQLYRLKLYYLSE